MLRKKPRVVIIGAGIAGIFCAKRLQSVGLNPIIYEKSRAVGGRVSTRRIDNGEFNHGARKIGDFSTLPIAFDFEKNIFENGYRSGLLKRERAYFTFTKSMSKFTGFLSNDLKIEKSSKLVSIKRSFSGSFSLTFLNLDRAIECDILILAIPQPQAVSLLERDFSSIVQGLKSCSMRASAAALFGFQTTLETNFEIIENHKITATREKYGTRDNNLLDCWTVHTKKKYGTRFSRLQKAEIATILFADFQRVISKKIETPVYKSGHRWLYGFTERPLGVSSILDGDNKIGLCGDWCLGEGVLDAASSGVSLANRVIKI